MNPFFDTPMSMGEGCIQLDPKDPDFAPPPQIPLQQGGITYLACPFPSLATLESSTGGKVISIKIAAVCMTMGLHAPMTAATARKFAEALLKAVAEIEADATSAADVALKKAAGK